MVLYLVRDDVLTVPTIPAIPAPHWDDVIAISSDEEYSSHDEKYGILEDDAVPAVPWDDVIVISSDEEPEMPAKKVSVKSSSSLEMTITSSQGTARTSSSSGIPYFSSSLEYCEMI
ncbi:hypothetical protein Tco_1059400 [Tanacetum coccineum]